MFLPVLIAKIAMQAWKNHAIRKVRHKRPLRILCVPCVQKLYGKVTDTHLKYLALFNISRP